MDQGPPPDDMAAWVEAIGGRSVHSGGPPIDAAGAAEERLVRKIVEWLDGPDAWWAISRRVAKELSQRTTLDFDHLFEDYPQVGFVLHRARPDVRAINATNVFGKPGWSPLHNAWCRAFDAHARHDKAFGIAFEWVGVDRSVCVHNATVKPNPRDVRFVYPARVHGVDLMMTVEPLNQFLGDQFGPPWSERQGLVDAEKADETLMRRRGAKLKPRRRSDT